MASCSSRLLTPSAAARIIRGRLRYPEHYDEVLIDVHTRLRANGSASKLDLAALIGWKHVRNAPWMRDLLSLPDQRVRSITKQAFRLGLADSERIEAVRDLPGYGGGGAFTSVLFTAWDPTRYGVFDGIVQSRQAFVANGKCGCDWKALCVYWEHLRRLAQELMEQDVQDTPWTPRDVEMGILNV